MLEVRESNMGAIGLYQRHGFVEVGRRKKFYLDGEGAVLMNREAGFRGVPWPCDEDDSAGAELRLEATGAR